MSLFLLTPGLVSLPTRQPLILVWLSVSALIALNSPIYTTNFALVGSKLATNYNAAPIALPLLLSN